MSKDNTTDGCVISLIVITIKALAVLALYHWILQPLFGWQYDLGFFESAGIAILISIIF